MSDKAIAEYIGTFVKHQRLEQNKTQDELASAAGISRSTLSLLERGETVMPAYDICHAYKPGSEWVSQHALSINGKRKGITKADLLVIGESIRCKKASEIVDEINETVKQWKRFADEVKVKPSLRDEIAKTLLDLKK